MLNASCEGTCCADHLWIGGISVDLAAATGGSETHYYVGVGDEDEVFVTRKEGILVGMTS